jgi:hypothetical protein
MAEPNPDAKARRLERQRQYREANRELLREKNRQYREANRDEINERHRQRYDPQQSAARYRANRGKISEQQRAYYQANRQERLAAVKSYADTRRPEIQEYKRKYYQASGAKVRQNVLEDRHGRGIAADWAAMWEAQQGRCYLCERDMDPDDAHVEHWHGCGAAHDPKKSCRLCRRGLAHQNCNIIVGQAADDPSLLRIIADNLERANADIAARQAVIPQHITLF